MESKNRDEKIYITDVAVEKAGRIIVPGFADMLNDELQRHHRELLLKAKTENDSNEVLRIWNIFTGDCVDTLGTENYVSPSMNPKALTFVSKSKAFSLGFLHNHPSTSGFSYEDIDTFLKTYNIALMSVVTNQGEVYMFYKTDDFDFNMSKTLFNMTVDKLGGAGARVGDEFAKAFSKICRKGGVIYGRR